MVPVGRDELRRRSFFSSCLEVSRSKAAGHFFSVHALRLDGVVAQCVRSIKSATANSVGQSGRQRQIDNQGSVIAAEDDWQNAGIRAAPMRRHQHVVDADAEQPREFRVTEATSAAGKRVLELSPILAVNPALDW